MKDFQEILCSEIERVGKADGWRDIDYEAVFYVSNPEEIADSLLVLPEMQQIRATLLHFAKVCAWTKDEDMKNPVILRNHLRIQGISSEAILDWVLG